MTILQSYRVGELYKPVGIVVVQNLKEHLQTYNSVKGPVEVERDVQWFGENAVVQQVPEYGVCSVFQD